MEKLIDRKNDTAEYTKAYCSLILDFKRIARMPKGFFGRDFAFVLVVKQYNASRRMGARAVTKDFSTVAMFG